MDSSQEEIYMREEQERGICISGAAGQKSPTMRTISWEPIPHFPRPRPTIIVDGELACVEAYQALKGISSDYKIGVACESLKGEAEAIIRMQRAGMVLGSEVFIIGGRSGVGKSIVQEQLRAELLEAREIQGYKCGRPLMDDLDFAALSKHMRSECEKLPDPVELCDDMDRVSPPHWAPRRKGEGHARHNFCGKHRGGRK